VDLTGRPNRERRISTLLSPSGSPRATTGLGQILPFERGGDGGGSGVDCGGLVKGKAWSAPALGTSSRGKVRFGA
jgi:hypothetical protein